MSADGTLISKFERLLDTVAVKFEVRGKQPAKLFKLSSTRVQRAIADLLVSCPFHSQCAVRYLLLLQRVARRGYRVLYSHFLLFMTTYAHMLSLHVKHDQPVLWSRRAPNFGCDVCPFLMRSMPVETARGATAPDCWPQHRESHVCVTRRGEPATAIRVQVVSWTFIRCSTVNTVCKCSTPSVCNGVSLPLNCIVRTFAYLRYRQL